MDSESFPVDVPSVPRLLLNSPERPLIAAVPFSAPTHHSAHTRPSSLHNSVAYARLPIEVCERIIDAVGVEHGYMYGDNNNKTLLACCLPSRDWFYRASRYLYTGVDLYVDRVATFGKGLEERPKVPDLVKTLRVWQREGHPHRDLSFLPKYFSQTLPNLTRIGFYRVDFTVVYPEYSLTLHKFTTVTSIVYQDVTFHSLHQLFRHVNTFPHLNDLNLTLPTFRTLDAGNPLSTPLTRRYIHKLHVQTVCINLYERNHVHVFELFSPTSITSLTLYFKEDSDKTTGPALASFLRLARDTLREFELHVRGDIRPGMPLGESSSVFVILISRSCCSRYHRCQ